MENCNVPRWQTIKATLDNLDYDQFLAQIDAAPNSICIDVRTPTEFQSGHIPNAINLDYLSQALADDLEKLDKDQAYYIYCRTGRRSTRVCVILQNLGFEEVYNLRDGIKDIDLN